MINLWTANLPKNQIEQKALVYNFGKLTISPSIRIARLLIHSQPPFKKANQSADVSKKSSHYFATIISTQIILKVKRLGSLYHLCRAQVLSKYLQLIKSVEELPMVL